MPHNYLAIDTSQHSISVALCYAGEVTAKHITCPAAEQSERLLPTLNELLAEAGCGFPDLSGLLVGIGPGRFMGVRQALALVHGFAHAQAIPVAGFSSLQIAALSAASQEAEPIVAVYDARMGEYYWAVYCIDEGVLKESIPPSLSTPTEILKQLAGGTAKGILVGDEAAASLYSHLEDSDWECLPAQAPNVEHLLHYVCANPSAIAWVNARELQPLYVRNQVAHRKGG